MAFHDLATDLAYSPHTKDVKGEFLVDYSPQDQPWDVHRAQAQALESMLAEWEDGERYARRLSKCSGILKFGIQCDNGSGEVRLRLREARFCRFRHCPVCQWRRCLMWRARFYQSLPQIVSQYPSARWLMLTLTVKNCSVNELRSTIQHMNQSWQRLIKREEFKPVLGWIRTTEVTKGINGTAHPHYHVLMMVQAQYFGKYYVKQERWRELWKECLRVDYTPVVDIRVCRSKSGVTTSDAVRSAAVEVLKYSTKPADMVEDTDWFQEMMQQVFRLKFIASGGVLKRIFASEKSDDELIDFGSDHVPDDGKRLAFMWNRNNKKYKRFPAGDV